MMRPTPIQRLIDYQTQRHYYKDRLSSRSFGRIVGGLAFPFGGDAGYAVVLGEILRKDPEQHMHHIFVLGETSAHDHMELLGKVAMLQDRTLCREWVTPTDNNYVLLVDDYNEEHRYRHRRAPIDLCSPPYYDRGDKADIFRFYDRLVAKRTTGRKTLHFGGSAVADRYAAITPDDIKRHPQEFPPVAAFLYALAELDLNQSSGAQWTSTGQPADSVGGW